MVLYSHSPAIHYMLDVSWQVTGKLDHAHTGIYFIYFGAVVGSSGLIISIETASLFNRDIIADAEIPNPNHSLFTV